jgi:hypothetical protein
MRDLPLVGEEFAGYRLLAVIRRGGMSTVYRAPGGPPRARARPFPAERPGDRPGRPAEVAHEPAGAYGGATEAIPVTVGLGASERRDRPGYGAAGAAAGTPLGGTGDSPSPARPHRAGRGRARRRGWPRWLAFYAAIVLALAAGAGVALVKGTGGGTSTVTLSGDGTSVRPPVNASVGPAATLSPTAEASLGPSSSPSVNMGVQAGDGQSGPRTLAGVLAAANSSVEGHGLLPPAKCGDYEQNAGGAVVCTAPVAGVAQVFYQNYSSLSALYSAYTTEVADLDGGTFRENTGTCGNSAVSYTEFGWNQEEGHPHDFTVAQMASGKVGQIFAAGRMACFATRTKQGLSQDIVWTIDNGPAMGVAIGNGSPRAVYQLWASLHHAVLFRGTEMCGTADRMNAADIPTGNLKVVPACPPGVEALPASRPS